eukprot:528844-Pelagomonas_calceolata.AAC.3
MPYSDGVTPPGRIILVCQRLKQSYSASHLRTTRQYTFGQFPAMGAERYLGLFHEKNKLSSMLSFTSHSPSYFITTLAHTIKNGDHVFYFVQHKDQDSAIKHDLLAQAAALIFINA